MFPNCLTLQAAVCGEMTTSTGTGAQRGNCRSCQALQDSEGSLCLEIIKEFMI